MIRNKDIHNRAFLWRLLCTFSPFSPFFFRLIIEYMDCSFGVWGSWWRCFFVKRIGSFFIYLCQSPFYNDQVKITS